jgi:multidrug resistance protein, MATE family
MVTARLPAWARPTDMLDLLRLALPVALSRSSFMLMGLTDAVILARYAPGDLPLVLNGWLPNGVVMGLGIGLMIGVQVLTAELNGSGKGADTGRIFRRGLAVALVYALVSTALVYVVAAPLLHLVDLQDELIPATVSTTHILCYGILGHMVATASSMYLEALRRPNLVTAVSMTAVVVNLVFDILLVPHYGAEGVAWATTGSRFFMAATLLGPVLWLTPARRRSPAAERGEFWRQNKVGLGAGLANVAEWGAFNLTFIIATRASVIDGTIYGLAVQMMGVVFMVHMGLGNATSVRVAEAFGQRAQSGVRDAARLGIAASLLVGLVLAIVLAALREPIAVIWLNASDPASEGAKLVPMLALMLAAAAFFTVFDGLQGVASMALRAQNVVWAPTLIHVGSYILVMLPLAEWAAIHRGMGAWGVMLGAGVASVLAGLGQVVLLEHRARRDLARADS